MSIKRTLRKAPPMGTTFSTDVHNAMRTAIEHSGEPVSDIAGKSHMSADYLYKRLRNELPFTVTDIERICTTLDIDPYDLIDGARPAKTEHNPNRLANQLRTIASQVANLQPADEDRLNPDSQHFDPNKLTNEEREQLARERLKSKVTLAANIDPHMQDEINHGGERV